MGDAEDLRAVEASVAENVRLGYMEVWGVGDDGQVRYRLTPAGEARVEALLAGDQEAGDG
jgi:hypothetical protein